MQKLTSLQNPAVLAACELAAAKGRARQSAFWLDGEHMVSEALHNCREGVKALYVDEARLDDYAALLSQAPARAEAFAVPARVLEKISQVKTPQGIGAVCALPGETPIEQQSGRLMLLENVQDPGNVGTILRTLDAAGFGGCILTPGCADPYAPKTLRATMGSVFRVPISRAPSAREAACALHARGYLTLGAALTGEPFYQREALPSEVCVLIGNEGAGLTDEALAACSRRYLLPMRGGAESLNAAVAAAVFMYELMNHERR